MNDADMRGAAAGLVLAGGRSSRMGRDKALIRLFGEEGPTLLARAYGLLSALTPQVWVSCAARRPYGEYPCLFDDREGAGPLSGILNGLLAAEAAGFAALLVLPCDLPFMDAPTLRRLLAARADAPPDTLAALYVSTESGLLEPLAAVYETAALPFFTAAAAADRRRLFDVIPSDRRLHVPYGAAETRPFFNLNGPDDLKKASGRADRAGLTRF